MKRSMLLLLLLSACGAQESPARAGREREAAALVPRLGEAGVLDQLVALGEAGPLVEATAPGRPEAIRRLACVALGRIGGKAARERLIALLQSAPTSPETDGWMHLYAAVGLTEMRDPGTAVDLVLNLSAVNPDDSLAQRAAAERDDEYFTVDAQICDALLAMGMWNAEESLVEQLSRRHRVRVAIDAAATLRRRTGLNLPFRYNGSYADREADAEAWRQALRASREERRIRQPFDDRSPLFQARLREVVSWLGGAQVRLRLVAQRSLSILGSHALPALLDELKSENPVGQRQAAWVLGRIGDARAAPALRAALEHKDDDARAEAVEALRRLGDRESLPRIRAMLEDRDPETRAAAADFLGDHGGDADIAPLRAGLERERVRGTKTSLACALVRRGDKASAGALIAILVGGEQLDRERALSVLREASGQPFPFDVEAAMEERREKAKEIEAWFSR